MGTPPDYRWIDDARGLHELADVLAPGSACALDSESNSGFTYQERLCLLQINDGELLWLVDLLAVPGERLALEPLRQVFEDSRYRIDLHGGEFDVGCLKRDYDIALTGIWDSQQAASFLGWEKTGYGAVVERICGVDLPKAHTRHDWSRRPIEGEELQYALNDVRYLPPISLATRQAAQEADLEEEVLVACEAVEEATWNGGFKPAGFWGLKGVGKLSDEARQVLMALFQWRETVAEQLDLPAGRTLNGELMVALARHPPRNLVELRRFGVPKRITNLRAAELLEVIVTARREPPELPPRPDRRPYDRRAQRRVERLKKWRRREAERRGVPVQVVLPVVALKHLQRHGACDLESVPQLGAKRIALYGDELRRLLIDLEGR